MTRAVLLTYIRCLIHIESLPNRLNSAMHQLTPTVGQWYIRNDGIKFEIVDVGDGFIEIQNQDGSIDEVDTDEWPNLDLELGEEPDDMTGPFDNVPIPDEADGGDPVDIEAVTIEPQRVANEERVNNPDKPLENLESVTVYQSEQPQP